nr:unnamed protein product [Callosobruchus chinensis]
MGIIGNFTFKVNINEYNPIEVGVSTFIDSTTFCKKFKNKVLKLGNIKFPITLKDIPNFEQLNGLAINVFTVVDKEVAPLLLSKSNCSPRINLLMLSCNNFNTEDSSDSYDNITTYYHFAYIQICHVSLTCEHAKTRNDLESILVGFDDTKNGNTERYQKHEAFSIAYYLKCSYDDSLSKFRLYTGSDCQDWFAKELHRTALELTRSLRYQSYMSCNAYSVLAETSCAIFYPAAKAFCKIPLDVFKLFVDHEVIDLIVQEQTSWSDTNVEEIYCFFGIVICMGLVRVPAVSLYWSKNDLYHNNYICRKMTRDRFYYCSSTYTSMITRIWKHLKIVYFE